MDSVRNSNLSVHSVTGTRAHPSVDVWGCFASYNCRVQQLPHRRNGPQGLPGSLSNPSRQRPAKCCCGVVLNLSSVGNTWGACRTTVPTRHLHQLNQHADQTRSSGFAEAPPGFPSAQQVGNHGLEHECTLRGGWTRSVTIQAARWEGKTQVTHRHLCVPAVM